MTFQDYSLQAVNSVKSKTYCRLVGIHGSQFSFCRFQLYPSPMKWNPCTKCKKKIVIIHTWIAFKIHENWPRIRWNIFIIHVFQCLNFYSYTAGNPIVSYKREGDSTDGWKSSTSLGSSTAGDTFDWGSATSFTESREYAINAQLDPGLFFYFMSYFSITMLKDIWKK